VQISEKVARSLTEIVEKARHVDQLVAEVSTASREQSQGVQQITTAVTEMDKVVQSNAASAEESAGAAQELNAQAIALQQAVSQLQQLVGGRSEQRSPTTAATPAAALAASTLQPGPKTISARAPTRHGSMPRVPSENHRHGELSFKDV
jgi:uncharacterized phage infection (PIP) family protein YhgE